MPIKKTMQINKNKQEVVKYRCFSCEEELNDGLFYNSNSKAYKNKMPICKNCVTKLFETYLKEYKSAQKAMFRICGLLDIYYSKTLVDNISETKDNMSIIKAYMRQINSLPQYKDKCFQDSDIKDKIVNVDTISVGSNEENRKKWGKGYSDEEYERLNDKYDEWIKTSPHNVEGDIIILKNICKMDLKSEELLAEDKDNSKIMSTLMNMIKTAGLDGKSRKKASDEDKANESFGCFIESIEKIMPADKYEDEKLYADWTGKGKYYDEYYIRPLRNMVENRRDFPDVEKYRR